jgi:hypothetical protein
MNTATIRKYGWCAGPALLVALMTGCNRSETAAPAPVASAPAPAAAAAAAPAPAPAEEMYVESEPPPPPNEVVVASPGPGFVWVGGYWGWNAGRRAWVGGRWERPPHEHATWVQPRWDHRGRGYVFVKGYWR